MVTTISPDEYESAVQTHATILVGEAKEAYPDGTPDTLRHEIHEAVRGVIDGHAWFMLDEYGAAAHGCIIELSQASPSRFGDGVHSPDVNPTDVIEAVAYRCFEADVLDRALTMVGEE